MDDGFGRAPDSPNSPHAPLPNKYVAAESPAALLTAKVLRTVAGGRTVYCGHGQ
jgi:hypothetical protein